jgi:putative flippase GtrA
MLKENLIIGVVIAYLIAGFLIPTLINTGIYAKVPPLYLYVFLFAVFPAVALIGLFIALKIGKKLNVLWQFTKFAEVGVLNTAIDFGILNILLRLAGVTSGPLILFLNAISFSTATINSYYWNRSWVFKGAKTHDFITFFAVTLIGLSINSAIVFILTTFVDPIFVTNKAHWANVAKALATGVSLFWNFVGYRLIVFKK